MIQIGGRRSDNQAWKLPTKQWAIMSFTATADFTDPTPRITVSPLPDASPGCRFESAEEISSGIFVVTYRLHHPLRQKYRAESSGVALQVIGPTDPFIPLPIILITSEGTVFQQVVIANGSPQPQGSPSVVLEFHTILWSTNYNH